MFADVTDARGWETDARIEAPTRSGELKTKPAYLPGGISSPSFHSPNDLPSIFITKY